MLARKTYVLLTTEGKSSVNLYPNIDNLEKNSQKCKNKFNYRIIIMQILATRLRADLLLFFFHRRKTPNYTGH